MLPQTTLSDRPSTVRRSGRNGSPRGANPCADIRVARFGGGQPCLPGAIILSIARSRIAAGQSSSPTTTWTFASAAASTGSPCVRG